MTGQVLHGILETGFCNGLMIRQLFYALYGQQTNLLPLCAMDYTKHYYTRHSGSEYQIRGGNENNSKIIYLISQ